MSKTTAMPGEPAQVVKAMIEGIIDIAAVEMDKLDAVGQSKVVNGVMFLETAYHWLVPGLLRTEVNHAAE